MKKEEEEAKNQHDFQITTLFFVRVIVYLNMTKFSPVSLFFNKH